jgi:hypothetical protein
LNGSSTVLAAGILLDEYANRTYALIASSGKMA